MCYTKWSEAHELCFDWKRDCMKNNGWWWKNLASNEMKRNCCAVMLKGQQLNGSGFYFYSVAQFSTNLWDLLFNQCICQHTLSICIKEQQLSVVVIVFSLHDSPRFEICNFFCVLFMYSASPPASTIFLLPSEEIQLNSAGRKLRACE